MTVISHEGSESIELVLEPMGFPPAMTYQKALFDAGIPLTVFISNDIQNEYKRLNEYGVNPKRHTGGYEGMSPDWVSNRCCPNHSTKIFSPLSAENQ